MNVEFTFTLEIKVILIAEYTTNLNPDPCPNFESVFYIDIFLKSTSPTSINNTIYIIIVNII